MARSTIGVVALAAMICFATAGWTDLWNFPWTSVPLPIMMGIGCPNSTHCYITGDHGNDLFGVYWTSNSFQTVNPCTMEGHSLMLLALTMGSNDNGVAAGVGALRDPGILYTTSSTDWLGTADINLVTGQDVEAISATEYAFVGATSAFNNKNGVLISMNSGKNWKAHNWGANVNVPSYAGARYGAFPSTTTWYVTAGSWPGNNTSIYRQKDMFAYNHKRSYNHTSRKWVSHMPQASDAIGADNGYYGGITKTTDGGNTWTVQFSAVNNFYFNDINCFDVNNCMAVAEGFSDGDGPGARIFGTTNGGATWTQVFGPYGADSQASFMMVKMLSATEAWVVGGEAKSQFNSHALFVHTTNGGSTWTVDNSIKGVVDVIGASFPNNQLGYVTGLTELEVSTILKYSA